jgi:hypothetical protein
VAGSDVRGYAVNTMEQGCAPRAILGTSTETALPMMPFSKDSTAGRASPRLHVRQLRFDTSGQLKMDGQFGYDPKAKLRNIVVLQCGVAVKNVTVNASLTAPLMVHMGSRSRPVSDIYVGSRIVGRAEPQIIHREQKLRPV